MGKQVSRYLKNFPHCEVIGTQENTCLIQFINIMSFSIMTVVAGKLYVHFKRIKK